MVQLLDELLRDVGLTPPAGGSNPQVEAVTCDSRLVGPGSLFVGCLVSGSMEVCSGVKP